MPSYYVWLEYDACAPVSKKIKSEELRYGVKHQHGIQPSDADVNSLQPSLEANVLAAYARYNAIHPQAVVVAPTSAAIQQGREMRTRSAY